MIYLCNFVLTGRIQIHLRSRIPNRPENFGRYLIVHNCPHFQWYHIHLYLYWFDKKFYEEMNTKTSYFITKIYFKSTLYNGLHRLVRSQKDIYRYETPLNFRKWQNLRMFQTYHIRWHLHTRADYFKSSKNKKIFISKIRLFSGSFWSILNFDFPEQRYNHCYIHIYSLRPYFCIHYFLNTHRFPNRTHRYRYSYRAHLCFQSIRHFAGKLHPLQSLASMSIRKNRRDLYRSSSHRNYEFLNTIVNANTLNE